MTFLNTLPLLSYLRQSAPLFANHLWQTTLCAIAVAGTCLAFSKSHSRVRFALWLAASIKFLVPFTLLVSLGSYLAPSSQGPAASPAYEVVTQVSAPFPSARDRANSTSRLQPRLLLSAAVLWSIGTASLLVVWALRWNRVRRIKLESAPLHCGREFEALRQIERQSRSRDPLPIRLTQQAMEPGIFGILRPTLLWPQGFSNHLTDAQVHAILAHELWHVRRRDNLTSAVHMFVQAIFWFHPLTWWIGARLVEERELACDEEVLRLGNDPGIYAESLLTACRFCLESPLTCVSGVAGSNLKRRIARIMNTQTSTRLSQGRRLLLAAAAVTVVVGPVLFGALHAPQLRAQTQGGANAISAASGAPQASFATISIKPALAADKVTIQIGDHTFTSNASVKELIKFAYGVEVYQIEDAPAWTGSERYDIAATWKDDATYNSKVSAMPGPPPPPAPAPPSAAATGPQSGPQSGPQASPMVENHLAPFQLQAMVQNLLASRFHLKWNSQMKDLPVYNLVVASTGAKLTPTPTTPPPPSFNGEAIIGMRTTINKGNGELTMSNGPVNALAGFLSGQLDHQVIDETGLQGSFNVTLHWTPDQDLTASISQSLEEQLGLKLEPQHGPVKVLAVNDVEKPQAD